MTTETRELVERLKRGAQHFEDDGDIGMPLLLRDAAATITRLTEERDAAKEALRPWEKLFADFVGPVNEAWFDRFAKATTAARATLARSSGDE